MSAIAGLFLQDGADAIAQMLEGMSGALALHGRDGGGGWRKNDVGLVSQRIVFTPQDRLDTQPLLSSDHAIAVIFAGRIDNRAEIAKDLGIASAQIDRSPDSQFLLQAYQHWGAECAIRLIGDFTFAIWDDRSQVLQLFVSPLSGRPLFYHASARNFAFSTMPKGLFVLPFVSRALDQEYLAARLARVAREPGTTEFVGIRRVLPGCLMTVRPGEIQSRLLCSPDLTREVRYHKEEDYVDAFLDLFERVTRDHLRTEAGAGIMLSGGLDSTAIAAMASSIGQTGGRRLSAWTSAARPGFQLAESAGRDADESAIAERVARYCDIDLSIVRMEREHLMHDIDTYFEHSESLFRNAMNRPWYEAILADARRCGIKTLLVGNQGNLTLSWFGSERLPQLVRQGAWREAAREAHAIAHTNHERSAVRLMLASGVAPLFPLLGRYVSAARRIVSPNRGAHKISVLRADYASRHGVEKHRVDPSPIVSALDSRRARWETIQGTSAVAAAPLAGYQARYGVELRDPTGDMRIVDFCLALPVEQFQKDGISRRLVRRAMAGKLPEEVFTNRHRGLQAADWYLPVMEFHQTLRQELDHIDACPLAHELIDTDGLRAVLDRLCAGNARGGDLVKYRSYLEEGFMVGSFIRWFEAGER